MHHGRLALVPRFAPILLIGLGTLLACDSDTSAPEAPPAAGPVITGVTPATLTVGADATVTGTDFGSSGELLIEGVVVATTAYADTTIRFTVPAGLTGIELSLSVRTGGRTSAAFAVPFTEPVERQLTSGGTNAANLCWGNDGYIYFHGPTPVGDSAIWKVPIAGGDVVLAFNGPGDDYFPDVLWVGGSVLWSSSNPAWGNDDGSWEIYSGDTAFDTLAPVDQPSMGTNTDNERDPAWNQDVQLGIRFAWSEDRSGGNSMIYVMNHSTPEPLVAGFSPRFRATNGDRLGFTTRRGDGGSDIKMIDLRNGRVESTIYGGPEVRDDIDWSTNGHILYVTGSGDIWMMDEDGTDHRPIVESPASMAYPRFSPSGNYIAFARLVGGAYEIFIHTVP